MATDDAGIVAYDDFITAMYDNFGSNGMITDPPNVDAWTDANQVRFSFTFDGRPVVVDAFLVDSLETAGDTFQERYDSLSKRADLIVYNGHAGYGDAIRQFGQMGDWTPGQYAVVFMNACDTYAYGDGAIEKAHAAANVDDPTGSKHVDTIYNVMPSDFGASTFATMTLINGLVDYSAPKSYDTMLEEIYRHIDGNDEIYGQQVPIVVGDEDNVFFPGRDLFTLFETGSVDPGGQDAYSIGDLAAGEYDFYLSATGDNNMVVVAGSTTIPCDPTTGDFSKHCHLDLDESAAVSVVVRGNEAMDYEVRGSGCYGRCTPPGAGLIELAAGDANRDIQFDQKDIVQVLQAAKYLTGEPATFEEGDWNGDGVFDQLDIVAALQTGNYLQGPYAERAIDAVFREA